MKSHEWLNAAIQSQNRQTPEEMREGMRTTDLADLCPGDIWIVRAAGETSSLRRSVLVLDADQKTGVLDVALMSNQIDFATDNDIVLDSSHSRVPYRLMVETDLNAKIDWRQAKTRIGMISDDLLDMILDFIWDERPDPLEELRGLPHPDRAREPLVSFQKEEITELRQLLAEGDSGTQPSGQRAGLKLVDSSVLSMETGRMECVAATCALSSWREVHEGRSQFCFLGFKEAPLHPPGAIEPPVDQQLVTLWALSQSQLMNVVAINLLSTEMVTESVAPYGGSGLCSLTMRVGERNHAQSVFVTHQGIWEGGPAGVFDDGGLLFLDECND
jgi:hypothetical protein